MHVSTAFLVLLSTPAALAAFTGDIVRHWNTQLQSGLADANPKLSSVNEGRAEAFVHASIFSAADSSKSSSRAIQQIAVSYAAYNSILALFAAQESTFQATLQTALTRIGGNRNEARNGKEIGEKAAAKVVRARAEDGADNDAPYVYDPPAVGKWQPAPDNTAAPASPNGGLIRPFAGLTTPLWRAPPSPTGPGYGAYLRQIIEKGALNNSTRTPDETEIGFYWLESSATYWNRFASTLLGERHRNNVHESARFFALLNFSLANAGFVAWKAKYHYETWRPISAVRWPGAFLASGNSLSNPDWLPLRQTPAHPDYLSGHAVYGSGAGGILRKYFGDQINPPVSIASTTPIGVITRTFGSVHQAVVENGDSRVFVGVHFQFASDEGNKAGYDTADRVWKNFKNGWKEL